MSKSPDKKKPGRSRTGAERKAERDQRAGAALRANLRRRKDQLKARQDATEKP